jgi:hypothetical protein
VSTTWSSVRIKITFGGSVAAVAARRWDSAIGGRTASNVASAQTAASFLTQPS